MKKENLVLIFTSIIILINISVVIISIILLILLPFNGYILGNLIAYGAFSILLIWILNNYHKNVYIPKKQLLKSKK